MLRCGKVAWPPDYRPAPPGESDCIIWELEQSPRLSYALSLSGWSPRLDQIDLWTAQALETIRAAESRMMAERPTTPSLPEMRHGV